MNIFEMSEDEILEKFETKDFLENLPNFKYTCHILFLLTVVVLLVILDLN
jgi:hypothetical protein